MTPETVAQKGAAATPLTPQTPEQQQRAGDLLAERTDRHQDLVKRTAALVRGSGVMYEDPFSYDLLWVPHDERRPCLLFEMKTLYGGDDAAQCRRAVGQLTYYHFFEVSPIWPNRGVVQIAVVDGQLSKDLLRYLTNEEIAAISYPQGRSAQGLNRAGVDVLASIKRATD